MEEKDKKNVEDNADSSDELLDDDLLEKEESGESDGKQADKNAEKQENGEQKKRKQDARENAHYAELRRKNRELKEQNERLLKEKTKAEFDLKANAIPEDVLEDLGITEISDDDDLFEANAYIAASKAGKENPRAEARKALKERRKAEQSKADEEAKLQAEKKSAVEKDRKAFIDKYGKEAFVVALKEDSKFMKLYSGFLDYGNLTSIYERFLAAEGADKEADEAAKKAASIITNQKEAEKPDPKKETKAQFKERWKAQYGEW